jgi:hypothetical protein
MDCRPLQRPVEEIRNSSFFATLYYCKKYLPRIALFSPKERKILLAIHVALGLDASAFQEHSPDSHNNATSVTTILKTTIKRSLLQ